MVFPPSKQLSPENVSLTLLRTCRKLKIADFRLHDLRHTSASLMLSAGIHPKIVSERLGHSSITITLDLYSHVIPGMQADAAEKLGVMILG